MVLIELDWETGLREEVYWRFWRSPWGDFWARGPARTKLRGSLKPGAFGGPKKSMVDIFSFILYLELSEEGGK